MANPRTRRIGLILAIILLAALFAFGYTRYQRDIDRAFARISTGSQVVQTRCGPIEYAVAGEGPPVLIVHGAGGGFDQGMDLGESLVRNGFRVIAMSRFGYLHTPLPANASPAAQADAHACLLDTLHIQRVAVVGASAGAPSSMQFALRHPKRTSALILLVPAAYVPRPGDAPSLHTPPGTRILFDTALRSDFLFWAGTKFARETIMRAILATPSNVVKNATANEQARVQQMMEHILPVSPRRLGLLNDASVTSSLPRYDLEKITAPTLVISVEDDLFGTFDSARYTAAHIPHTRFIGYKIGGHIWVGHHNEVVSEIAAFLK